MRHFSVTRIAVVGLSLGLLAAPIVSFTGAALAAQQQTVPRSRSQANSYDPSQKSTSNFDPYDSPDFILQDSDIHS